jgi:hypothetical protein
MILKCKKHGFLLGEERDGYPDEDREISCNECRIKELDDACFGYPERETRDDTPCLNESQIPPTEY